MSYFIVIPDGMYVRRFRLLPYGDFQYIEVPGVVIFNIYKFHDHRYDLEGFFYSSKKIISRTFFRSKKELFGAIQFLLQENLNVDVQ